MHVLTPSKDSFFFPAGELRFIIFIFSQNNQRRTCAKSRRSHQTTDGKCMTWTHALLSGLGHCFTVQIKRDSCGVYLSLYS